MKLSDFDYTLPPELIAQRPRAERDASRLLVLERGSGRVTHSRFLDLPNFLEPGDLLVLNDTRVFPARLFGRKATTGGRVEVLLLEELGHQTWVALLKPYGCIRASQRLAFADGMEAVVEERLGDGQAVVRFFGGGPFRPWLSANGRTPLPPYIKRDPDEPLEEKEGRERYQTVFAARPGAVAAPTAGLHFTERMFEALSDRRGRAGHNHAARGAWDISAGCDGAAGGARHGGGELRGRPRGGRGYQPGGRRGPTDHRRRLNRRAGHRKRGLKWWGKKNSAYRGDDGALHLSGLHVQHRRWAADQLPPALLDAAVAGLCVRRQDRIFDAYREAVDWRYRLYSYGDAMLIL